MLFNTKQGLIVSTLKMGEEGGEKDCQVEVPEEEAASPDLLQRFFQPEPLQRFFSRSCFKKSSPGNPVVSFQNLLLYLSNICWNVVGLRFSSFFCVFRASYSQCIH